MVAVIAQPLPESSLLARHRGPECYRDAFCAVVPSKVTLTAYITAFYASGAFWPERMALFLIGRGARQADITALAEGHSESFAAWSVEAREEDQILLRDFQDRTCSWLRAEPVAEGTALWFGSGVRNAQSKVVNGLLPVHSWYAKRLLTSAVKALA